MQPFHFIFKLHTIQSNTFKHSIFHSTLELLLPTWHFFRHPLALLSSFLSFQFLNFNFSFNLVETLNHSLCVYRQSLYYLLNYLSQHPLTLLILSFVAFNIVNLSRYKSKNFNYETNLEFSFKFFNPLVLYY